MLTDFEMELAKKYMPAIWQDKNETIPIRYVGITVFDHRECSKTFGKRILDPAEWNVQYIIEYAFYWDYDIQHMYDLEHILVGVRDDGSIGTCCTSFHGLIVHSSSMKGMYREEDGHPVLYMQPGKHAFMADPFLFNLHVQKDVCCNSLAGGGLLIPQMLADSMDTDSERDEGIRSWIRSHYSFKPSWKFVAIPEFSNEQLVSSDELLNMIPGLVAEQLKLIEGSYPDFYRKRYPGKE